MISFENLVVDLGEITKGSKHAIEFPFTGDSSEIVEIQPGCSCTANCTVEDGKVVAVFTESDKLGNKAQYPSGYYPISKTITIYLKDENDLQISTPAGVVYNPHKKKEILRFNARVKI